MLFLPLAVSGCARPLRPIFEEQRPAMIWPAPPTEAPARIRYVGQLASSADLKPPQKPFQALGDLFVGAKAPERLYGPRAIVCTEGGQRVWVADPGGRCVHVFDLDRREYTKIERAGNEHLLTPVGLCLGPDHSIFVCDSEAIAVHRFNADTNSFSESLRLPEDVIRPAAISYSAADGKLYVVDVSAHDIKVLELDGSLRRLLGSRGREAGEFNFPCDIVHDGDLIWVVDAGNHRVQGLTRTGEPVLTLGQAGDAMGDLALPKGVALDSDGHIYVVDARFENVQVFDGDGTLLLVFGQEGIGPGEFWLPAGIYIDANDRIWICDSYNGRVQVFDYLKPPGQPESDLGERIPALASPGKPAPAPPMEIGP
ncbi:MAG: 6-bladed beta-propeller [Phycisphaerales bacterium]|nr:MAG: 6-bladed beta-propeller [Phycisphaerales bacterium]